MELSRPKKIILRVLIFPPLLVVGIVIVALIWPTTPQQIEEVFLGACGEVYDPGYAISERPHSYSIAPQGVWYDESGKVIVPIEVANKIYNNLANNSEFDLKNGYFEKFVVGKVLANCTVNLESGVVKYKYVLW